MSDRARCGPQTQFSSFRSRASALSKRSAARVLRRRAASGSLIALANSRARRACARSRSASVSLSVTARASADNKVILKIDQGSLVPPIKRARVGSKSKAPPEGRGARISALQACDCCAACRTSRPAPVRKRSAQRSGPTATAQWRSPSARIRRAGGASGRAWPLERSSPRGRSPRCG